MHSDSSALPQLACDRLVQYSDMDDLAEDLARLQAHSPGCAVRSLVSHPDDPSVVLCAGDDGNVVLLDLSSGGSDEKARNVLAQSGGAIESDLGFPPACVDLAFDAETNYLVGAFDNEAAATLHRHPRLGRGARFA